MPKEFVVGKSALFYKEGLVPHTTRVMIVDKLADNEYVLANFDNPSELYKVETKYFTMEKEADQETEDVFPKYLKAYKESCGG